MTDKEHILAVGDLHARYDLLRKVLDELAPGLASPLRMVFLGDYIDRGPEARQILERLLDLARRRPDTVFLLGNHERMLLDALEGRRVPLFLNNGGRETLASYGLPPERIAELPAAHQAFLRAMPLYHQTDDYIFVHAGLRPGLPLEQQDEADLLWIRHEFIYSEAGFGKTVVFGHTPLDQPLVRPGRIGIDTGAVYGNHLTCLELPQMRFHTLT
jgi:serine/threonine protein phosphatase 1